MAFTAAVFGLGAVGARVARQLASTPAVERLTVADRDRRKVDAVLATLDDPGRVRGARPDEAWAEGVDVGVVATGPGTHLPTAERLLEAGVDVVSVSDDLDDVRELLELDAEARERGRTVAVGAAFAPGLTCVLAAHAAGSFDQVQEIHVAKVGTGGPSCARQRHDALAGQALDWRDGAWVRRRAGSGRELCWFPEPVGAEDCYRAEVPDATLLVPVFPGVARVTARVAANRRDRLTARLPMLRPPHPEGGPGAVRVEVRGWRGAVHDVTVFGAMDRPAVAAGTVAACAAIEVGEGRVPPGAAGLAASVAPVPFLVELARRGVKAAVFDGSAT